jgi:hypothetical protein
LAVPAAFLSHSTTDSDLSRKLATDLRTAGVDVWYAEWELKPGDSLYTILRKSYEDQMNAGAEDLVSQLQRLPATTAE